jgi:hypothetical protein
MQLIHFEKHRIFSNYLLQFQKIRGEKERNFCVIRLKNFLNKEKIWAVRQLRDLTDKKKCDKVVNTNSYGVIARAIFNINRLLGAYDGVAQQGTSRFAAFLSNPY